MRGFWLLCILLACSVAARAQSELPKNVLELAQLKRNAAAEVARLSNFTCLETVERSHRKSQEQPFRYADTVRLEVALSNNRELYGWPGANHFEEHDVGDVVGSGTISSGSFASDVKAALVDNVSTIVWHGEEEIIGRRALRWDYVVPYYLSGWIVEAGGHRGRVSATGSFWADAKTLELLRLRVNASDIPPDLPIMAAEDTLDFARFRVGSRNLLLPQTAEFVLTDLRGRQSRNVMEFSHCREFTSEAKLSYEAPAVPEEHAAPATELAIPAGLLIDARLAEPIDSKVAAVGDPISATIEVPVKNKGQILIPEGALLRGRLRRMEKDFTAGEHFVVGLEFTDIEFPGRHARFFGDLVEMGPLPDSRWAIGAVASTTQSTIAGSTLTRTTVERYTVRAIPGVGMFLMDGASFRIAAGLRMVWRTVEIRK